MSTFKKNNSGFGVIELLLVFAILGIVGYVGWYVFASLRNTNNAYSTATDTSNTASPKFAKVIKQTSTASSQHIVKISELGIQITLPVTLSDLNYVVSNVDYSASSNGALSTYPTAYLGTKQLDDLGCVVTGKIGNAPPLGFLTKTDGQYPANPTADNTTGNLVKQFPTFYISYREEGMSCSQTDSTNQIQTKDVALLNSALSSVDIIK